MKRMTWNLFVLGLLALASATAAYAQAEHPAPVPPSGPRAEALRMLDDAATKMVRLAEAIPAEKYAWRPEGARSVSEVFMHVAAGNFNIPRRIGTPVPTGLDPRTLEKSTTEKGKVAETLKQSFEHARQAFIKVADTDLEKTTQWFGGREATYREIMFFLVTHQHEHLGQSIAYARMVGVVPPWTEEQQQRQRQQQQPAKPQE